LALIVCPVKVKRFAMYGPQAAVFKGDLPAGVKRVVWHEVAHWLGHDEKEVKI